MPDMDGEDTYREIRKKAPQMPVVFSSGYGEQEVMDRFVDQSSVTFVQKPYLTESLKSAVMRTLLN